LPIHEIHIDHAFSGEILARAETSIHSIQLRAGQSVITSKKDMTIKTGNKYVMVCKSVLSVCGALSVIENRESILS